MVNERTAETRDGNSQYNVLLPQSGGKLTDLRSELRSAVRLAYKFLLGRDPENEEIVEAHARAGSVAAIFETIGSSPESEARSRNDRASPFYNYASMFDAEALMRRYARHDLERDPRYLINFLGVRIEERYMAEVLRGKAGTVEAVPIPANWHADIAEWAAALRSVELARDTFAVAELGCGWGCWLNNTGVAARNRGLKPKLIGVEGDEGHIEFAMRCCNINGFSKDEVILHRGIAAARSGTAFFPKQDKAGVDWGLQPIFGGTEHERRAAVASGRYDELPMISMDTVIGDQRVLDLLHVDIQGGEADLVEQSRDVLTRRVAYLLVGTHSRVIEGRIQAALLKGPWRLEVERPAIVSLSADGPTTLVDGVQGWRNMDLSPD